TPNITIYTPTSSWLLDKLIHGSTSSTAFLLILFAAFLLICDVYKCLSGTSTPSPVPMASSPRLMVGEAAGIGGYHLPSPPSPPSSPLPLAMPSAKIFLLLTSLTFLAWQLFTHNVVSLDKPFLENLSGMLSYILRGWAVVALLGLLGFIVRWLHSRSTAAPVEVLFGIESEGALLDLVAAEEALVKSEKEFGSSTDLEKVPVSLYHFYKSVVLDFCLPLFGAASQMPSTEYIVGALLERKCGHSGVTPPRTSTDRHRVAAMTGLWSGTTANRGATV
ncbi:hypothetical protein K438DRAFT_2095526, partial [Mycena galopus ATCC 62051]